MMILKKIALFIFLSASCLGLSAAYAEESFLDLDLGIPETAVLISDIEKESVGGSQELQRQEEIPPYLQEELSVVEEPQSFSQQLEIGPAALRMSAALALVLFLLFLVLFFVKKFGPYSTANAKGMIEVLEHAALAPGKNLHLVKVASETVLLASDSNGIVFVKSMGASSFNAQGNPAKEDSQQGLFRSAFEGKIKDFQAEKAIKKDLVGEEMHDIQDNIHDIHAQIKKLKKMKDGLK